MSKKLGKLLIAGLLSVSAVYAYPNIDMSAGGAPFALIQQQQFQKNELNDYKQFKDAYENSVEDRVDTINNIEQLQSEYKIRDLRKPAKIQLGGSKTDTFDSENNDMQLIQQDGTIQIKRIDN